MDIVNNALYFLNHLESLSSFPLFVLGSLLQSTNKLKATQVESLPQNLNNTCLTDTFKQQSSFNSSPAPFGWGDISVTGLILAFESPCQAPHSVALWHPNQSNPCCIIQHCSQTCFIKDPGHGPWLWVWGFEWQICCQLSTNRHRPRVSPKLQIQLQFLPTLTELASTPTSTSTNINTSLRMCPTRDKRWAKGENWIQTQLKVNNVYPALDY